MPKPTSPIDVCNLALDRLGQASISSIDAPKTQSEDICARHYDTTRREILRDYIFNFAKKLATLTIDATFTPDHGFVNAYKLPNDFIRLLALGDTSINFDVAPNLYDLSENRILTNQGDNGSLKISYIFDATQVNHFDTLFLKLFKLRLAANMAYKFTLKNTFIDALLKEMESVQTAAAAVAGQEKPPRRIQRSRLIEVRRYGSINRDNTRV